MERLSRTTVAIAGVLALACVSARAEPTQTMRIARFETPPAIDGRLDDGAWVLAQGHHLRNDKPRVLAVFDEASGVPDEF